MNLYPDETERRRLFPVCAQKVFFGHAAVTALPRAVADAMQRYAEMGATDCQENQQVWEDIKATRRLSGQLIGAGADEIALLGPTSLGLSLFANGLDWQPGDEVVCYGDDYPANVYPWTDLRRRGVIVRLLKPERPGEITPELIAAELTGRTRLVALASAHFFSGTRIDVDAIGQLLHSRGVLFALDAIQTLGAYPISVQHVDFLSADAHKWLLGPMAIGIVYVKKSRFEVLRPTLLGAWNVVSPGFQAQEEIRFVPTAQRYEPGVLNVPGVYAMKAALELILGLGIRRIAERLAELKAHLVRRLDAAGYEIIGHREGPLSHAITTCRRPGVDHPALYQRMSEAGIVCSLRRNRAGDDFLRLSPHFYNTEEEIDRVAAMLGE